MCFAHLTKEKMCYNIRTGGRKPYYLIWLVIFTRRKNMDTDKEYDTNSTKHVPELEGMDLGFLITAKIIPIEQKQVLLKIRPRFEYLKILMINTNSTN